MAKWIKKTYKLEQNYKWKAKPGYNIFVAGRGELRFDIPEKWVIIPEGNEGRSIKFHDLQPPDDNCVLEVSITRFWGPALELIGDPPIPEMLRDISGKGLSFVLATGEIHHERRGEMELAWLEQRYMDPSENREAISRSCLARKGGIYPYITFAFWPEHEAQFSPVWDEVLRTLAVGEQVPGFGG